MKDLLDAKTLLKSQDHGIFSTISKKFPGYPFGSLLPYMVTEDDQIICWVSQIAQHSINLQEEPKASLTITSTEAARDQERLCLLVTTKRLTQDINTLKKAYLNKFPLAAKYIEIHDFFPLLLEVQAAYYIGGFGRALWVDWT